MSDAKPFEPTPGRIARAKREGDTPRSTEFTSAVAFASACVALPIALTSEFAAARMAFVAAAHRTASLGAYALLAAVALIPCAVAGAGGVVASGLLAGGIRLANLRIDFAKLQPNAGLRRMFSARSAGAGARALVAAAVATGAMIPIVRSTLLTANLIGESGSTAAAALDAVSRVLVTAAVLGISLGVIDAILERVAWRRRLRMTVAELKQDLKQSEGDPELRNRRRTHHRTLIRGSIERLPDASFVVANPSHVAIALEYRPPEVAVPRVIIRAIEEGARIVKVRARALGIPVIEDVMLARTLLTTTRIDEAIPRGCYIAVARIVAFLTSETPR